MITEDQIRDRLKLMLDCKSDYWKEGEGLLKRCIQRDYLEDRWSYDKYPDDLFYGVKDYYVTSGYNEYDFRFEEIDWYAHFHEIFNDRFIPAASYKYYSIGVCYPLPVRDWNNQDVNKGFYAYTILYANKKPSMVWECPQQDRDGLDFSDSYKREKKMHDDERTGKRRPSDYMYNTQFPYDATVYKQRETKKIPITDFQRKVIAAGGWPYDLPTKETAEKKSITDVLKEMEESTSTLGENFAIMTHCKTAKDTQPTSNIAHLERWEFLMSLINEGETAKAKDYAEVFAKKGWRAWKEVLEMLG